MSLKSPIGYIRANFLCDEQGSREEEERGDGRCLCSRGSRRMLVCVCVYECVSVVLRDKMRIGLSLDADLATFKLPDRVDVAAEIEVL